MFLFLFSCFVCFCCLFFVCGVSIMCKGDVGACGGSRCLPPPLQVFVSFVKKKPCVIANYNVRSTNPCFNYTFICPHGLRSYFLHLEKSLNLIKGNKGALYIPILPYNTATYNYYSITKFMGMHNEPSKLFYQMQIVYKVMQT